MTDVFLSVSSTVIRAWYSSAFTVMDLRYYISWLIRAVIVQNQRLDWFVARTVCAFPWISNTVIARLVLTYHSAFSWIIPVRFNAPISCSQFQFYHPGFLVGS